MVNAFLFLLSQLQIIIGIRFLNKLVRNKETPNEQKQQSEFTAYCFKMKAMKKTAIEFAVASLFATGENKNTLASNLKGYCQEREVH
jgi:hypothetical protein